ncbi:hypothetical protein ATY79_22250 [Rhizobium sp. R693]|nr:hypothetical protein ATY79_22250 [Rhizobium sp. R693]
MAVECPPDRGPGEKKIICQRGSGIADFKINGSYPFKARKEHTHNSGETRSSREFTEKTDGASSPIACLIKLTML